MTQHPPSPPGSRRRRLRAGLGALPLVAGVYLLAPVRRSFVAALLGVLVAVPSALAATPSVDEGSPSGPLTRVAIGDELSCQVRHTGDSSLEFFPPSVTPGDCGSFLVTQDTLFAPDFGSHGGTATGNLGSFTPFTPVSQTSRTGSGTSSSPYRVTTVVNAGSSGLRLTEVDTYVTGQESYRTDVTVHNGGGAAQSVILYRAGDCYLQDTDDGFGFTEPASKSVGCSANANNTPRGRIEEWVPITAGNDFSEDRYSTIWGQIGSHAPFPNACGQCTTNLDNGAGISWSFSVPAGGDVTRSHFTTFSPTGRTGPPPPTPTPTVVRCTVPNLRGKTIAQAKTLLRTHHCRLGTVSAPRRHTSRIATQSRAAGSVRAANTRVNVTLAGRAAAKRPRFTG